MSAVTEQNFLNTCSINRYHHWKNLAVIALHAVVCGTLGVAAASLRVRIHLAIGAATGLVAAIILPVLKGMIGGCLPRIGKPARFA